MCVILEAAILGRGFSLLPALRWLAWNLIQFSCPSVDRDCEMLWKFLMDLQPYYVQTGDHITFLPFALEVNALALL